MPATQVLVIGRQGTGKSTAWENMNPAETAIVTPNAKPLPWAGSQKQYVVGKNRLMTNKLTDLPAVLEELNKRTEIKYVLIDDFTHYFNARTLATDFINRKFGNDAFAKWNELGADVFPIITGQVEKFRDDLFIVFNGHTEIDDEGKVVLQTPGKLLDKTVKIDSYFTYVLHTQVVKGENGMQYKFLTNDNGTHSAKTPRGCFTERLIDNDIKAVLDRIRDYQNAA